MPIFFDHCDELPDVNHLSPAKIHYNEFGLPVSTEFDDIYFNNENGLAESRYVFLQHNDLPKRWQTHSHTNFVVVESGFGTGLNFLACWAAFVTQAPAHLRLHFISFEKYPLPIADLQQAHQHFPELAQLANELRAAYPTAHQGCHRLQLAQGRIVLDLWFGDIHQQLPQWLPHAGNSVDAWFLDGFAPDKNPQMWQPHLYQAMAQSARDGCTFATFTAAGAVRRELQDAGFTVTKVKGFGRKRDMLRGAITKPLVATTRSSTTVTIVGGGIGAACAAWSLTQRGIQVELLTTGVANGASGNAQGAVYPLLHAELSPLAAFYLSAFDQARQFYQSYATPYWHPTGVVQLAFNAAREQRHRKLIASGHYSADLVHELMASATQALWSALPALPALYYPSSGWLPPRPLVEHLLQACGERLQVTECAPITQLQATASGWQLSTDTGQQFQAQTVLLAAGAGLNQLLQTWQINLQNVRGQVTQVASTEYSKTCPLVVCYKGYFTPAEHGTHCVGATYARDYDEATYQQPQAKDSQENLATLADNLGHPAWVHQLQPVAERAALRNTTRDHLPVCGWLSGNLGVLGGLGSRGFTSAPLCAELIASQWLQEPLPLTAELVTRLAPQRLQVEPT